MKKKLKMLTFIMIVSIFSIINVNAETVKWPALKLNGNLIYRQYTNSSGKTITDTNISYINIDNNTAYCIEIGKDIYSEVVYTTSAQTNNKGLLTSYFNKNLNATVKIDNIERNVYDIIDLVAKYGSEYYNDNSLSNTKKIKYYLAAQSMIWEYLSDSGIYGDIKKGSQIKVINASSKATVNTSGKEINLDAYRKNILKKISAYYEEPSFSGYTETEPLKVEVKEEKITLVDMNEVLKNYTVKEIDYLNNTDPSNKPNCEVKDNSIKCSYNEEKRDEIIKIVLKKGKTSSNKVYKTGDKYQATLLASGNPEYQLETYVKIDIPKITLQIRKLDQDNDEPLQGAEFELHKYDEATSKCLTDIIGTKTTNASGIVTFKGMDNTDSYCFIETKSPEGYVPLTDPVIVHKDALNNLVQLQKFVRNTKEVISGNIKITKLDKEGNKPLEGVTFEIYDEDDKVVETLKTDKNGVATSKTLPKGTYYVKEKESLKDYLPYEASEEISITENKTYEISLTNEKVVPTGDSKILLLITISLCSLISVIVIYVKKINKEKNNTY